MEVCEKIKYLRMIKGMSQLEFGDALGVSDKAISKWEGGYGLPANDSLVTIANMFNITLDYLLQDKTITGEDSLMKDKIIELQDKAIIENKCKEYIEECSKVLDDLGITNKDLLLPVYKDGFYFEGAFSKAMLDTKLNKDYLLSIKRVDVIKKAFFNEITLEEAIKLGDTELLLNKLIDESDDQVCVGENYLSVNKASYLLNNLDRDNENYLEIVYLLIESGAKLYSIVLKGTLAPYYEVEYKEAETNILFNIIKRVLDK